MRTSAAFVALWAALVVAGDARQLPQGLPKFRTGVEVVQLDVSVLDSERRPIRGLTAADFIVLEDGKPQPLVAFKEVNVPDPPAVSASWMRDVAPDVLGNAHVDRRLVVLVLDDANMGGDATRTALEMKTTIAIAQSVVDRMGPDDLAAIVHTLDNRQAQDFTSDRGKLLGAIKGFRPGFGSDCRTMRSAMDTLAQVAQSLEDAPAGRKALIYVSTGLPIDWSQVSGGTMSANGAPACFTASQLMQLHDAIFLHAGRANINIYPIDPLGLRDASSPGTLEVDFLKNMSANTGGAAGVDTNDFDGSVAQVFRENGSDHLLGYQSTNEKLDGRLRKLEVRVNRLGATVRARSGYDAPKPVKSAKSAPPPLATAIAGLLPSSDVSMRAAVAPFAIAGSASVALAIATDVRQPSPKARLTESIDLQTSAFGPSGQPQRWQKQTARVVMVPSDADAQFEIVSRFDLKPGSYNLRLAAHSAALDKTGSVYYAVDIPDFAKDAVSLSGVVLSATSAIAAAGKEALASLIPVMPTTQREFATADEVVAFLRVYEHAKGPLESVRLETRIVDDHDTVKFHAEETLAAAQFDASRTVDHRLALPLGELSAGPHLLTIQATAGKASARRDVRFVVK